MNKRGFTMIELLATIVILGILSTIGVVSITKYITQSRQKAYKMLSETVYESTVNCVIQDKCSAPTTNISTDYLISKGLLRKLNNPIKNKKDCQGIVNIYEYKKPGEVEESEYKDFYYEVYLDCEGYSHATLIWPYSKTSMDVEDFIINSTSNKDEFINSKNK